MFSLHSACIGEQDVPFGGGNLGPLGNIATDGRFLGAS